MNWTIVDDTEVVIHQMLGYCLKTQTNKQQCLQEYVIDSNHSISATEWRSIMTIEGLLVQMIWGDDDEDRLDERTHEAFLYHLSITFWKYLQRYIIIWRNLFKLHENAGLINSDHSERTWSFIHDRRNIIQLCNIYSFSGKYYERVDLEWQARQARERARENWRLASNC
jgi:hypothetical protein